jgi:hypothetical protein
LKLRFSNFYLVAKLSAAQFFARKMRSTAGRKIDVNSTIHLRFANILRGWRKATTRLNSGCGFPRPLFASDILEDNMKLTRKMLCIALLAAASFSYADDAMLSPQTAPSGVKYLSGAIGESEQNAFDAQRKDFSLRLTFVQKSSGAYVADVTVVISNTHGEVLNVVVPGPFLMVQLAPGTYQIKATYNGEQQNKTLTIKQPKNQVFYFASE